MSQKRTSRRPGDLAVKPFQLALPGHGRRVEIDLGRAVQSEVAVTIFTANEHCRVMAMLGLAYMRRQILHVQPDAPIAASIFQTFPATSEAISVLVVIRFPLSSLNQGGGLDHGINLLAWHKGQR